MIKTTKYVFQHAIEIPWLTCWISEIVIDKPPENTEILLNPDLGLLALKEKRLADGQKFRRVILIPIASFVHYGIETGVDIIPVSRQ